MKNKKTKENKENKSSLEEMFKDWEFKPIDMDSFYSDWEAQIKKEEEKYYKEVEQEKDRVKNMTCPCCKSTDKQHFVQSENNGVMGSGYSSWVIQSYYVCMSCGIHYSDLSSKEIEKPYSLKNRFF